jgi:hypothetical protein
MNYIVPQSTHLMDKYLLNEITVKGTIFWPNYLNSRQLDYVDTYLVILLIGFRVVNRMSNCWCQRAIIKRPVACFPNTLFIACQKWPAGWVIRCWHYPIIQWNTKVKWSLYNRTLTSTVRHAINVNTSIQLTHLYCWPFKQYLWKLVKAVIHFGSILIRMIVITLCLEEVSEMSIQSANETIPLV